MPRPIRTLPEDVSPRRSGRRGARPGRPFGRGAVSAGCVDRRHLGHVRSSGGGAGSLSRRAPWSTSWGRRWRSSVRPWPGWPVPSWSWWCRRRGRARHVGHRHRAAVELHVVPGAGDVEGVDAHRVLAGGDGERGVEAVLRGGVEREGGVHVGPALVGRDGVAGLVDVDVHGDRGHLVGVDGPTGHRHACRGSRRWRRRSRTAGPGALPAGRCRCRSTRRGTSCRRRRSTPSARARARARPAPCPSGASSRSSRPRSSARRSRRCRRSARRTGRGSRRPCPSRGSRCRAPPPSGRPPWRTTRSRAATWPA